MQVVSARSPFVVVVLESETFVFLLQLQEALPCHTVRYDLQDLARSRSSPENGERSGDTSIEHLSAASQKVQGGSGEPATTAQRPASRSGFPLDAHAAQQLGTDKPANAGTLQRAANSGQLEPAAAQGVVHARDQMPDDYLPDAVTPLIPEWRSPAQSAYGERSRVSGPREPHSRDDSARSLQQQLEVRRSNGLDSQQHNPEAPRHRPQVPGSQLQVPAPRPVRAAAAVPLQPEPSANANYVGAQLAQQLVQSATVPDGGPSKQTLEVNAAAVAGSPERVKLPRSATANGNTANSLLGKAAVGSTAGGPAIGTTVTDGSKQTAAVPTPEALGMNTCPFGHGTVNAHPYPGEPRIKGQHCTCHKSMEPLHMHHAEPRQGIFLHTIAIRPAVGIGTAFEKYAAMTHLFPTADVPHEPPANESQCIIIALCKVSAFAPHCTVSSH